MGCGFSSADITGDGMKINIIRELAKGGFSSVLLCQDLHNGDKYAVKKIVSHSKEETERIMLEVEAHRQLAACPSACPLISLIQLENTYYLVLPFYAFGSVADELTKRKPTKNYLPTSEVLSFSLDVARAVKVLHERGYAHRDLKPANFLICGERQGVVLCDYGSVDRIPIEISNSHEHQLQLDAAAEYCSMPYRAPELFTCDIGSTITYAIDLWSLGCCLYALCYFQSPFDPIYEKGNSIALAAQSPEKIPYDTEDVPFPSKLIELIKRLLVFEPSQRLPIDALIQELEELRKSAKNENPKSIST